jgi:hypothetical protein
LSSRRLGRILSDPILDDTLALTDDAGGAVIADDDIDLIRDSTDRAVCGRDIVNRCSNQAAIRRRLRPSHMSRRVALHRLVAPRLADKATLRVARSVGQAPVRGMRT